MALHMKAECITEGLEDFEKGKHYVHLVKKNTGNIWKIYRKGAYEIAYNSLKELEEEWNWSEMWKD
jgi:hypothetical protein